MHQLFGIEFPIVQAPMAGVQDHALAASVSNAGGLGSLPCATLTPDGVAAELEAMRSRTTSPYNVNFFCHVQPKADAERGEAWQALLAPYYAEYGLDPESIRPGPGRLPFSHDAADVLERFRPPVVSFHFGLPAAPLLDRVRALGAKILSTATTVEEARWLEARGVDAIVVQGSEAGGHRGMFLTTDLATQRTTLDLLTEVVAAVRTPVIAAGAIADEDDVCAAMSAGACGVQVGTAYLLCPEAGTSPIQRAAIQSDAARRTAFTNIFTGRPARGIVNRLMEELGAVRDDVPAFPLATAALAPLRAEAEKLGRSDFTNMWAGTKVNSCSETPAAVLTARLGNAG
jgi:nitronate monooxygenase